MPELKPCPFCGGEAKLRRYSSSYRSHPTTILDEWGVECENDCCSTKRFRDDIFHEPRGEVIIAHNGAFEAAEAWNKRAGDLVG